MSEPLPSSSRGELSSQVRNWALGAHLSAFLGAWLTLAFVGAVKASNGETYRYPLTIRFVS